MPTNLYGPNDNFSDKESHVIPALIQRIHNAKIEDLPSVEVWGTGSPMREFLYVDDLAEASIFILENISSDNESPDSTCVEILFIHSTFHTQCSII